MEKTLLFLFKALMITSLFLSFFSIFSIQNSQILNMNRTSIVSFVTFIVGIILFIRIYGGFSIGQRRSKEIANTVVLASIMTDFITFLVMMIMGISTENFSFYADKMTTGTIADIPFSDFVGYYFIEVVLPGLGLLLLVILLQALLARIFTYLSNFIYFKINAPKPALIVYDNEENLPAMVQKISKYQNRWRISEFMQYNHPDMKRAIRRNGAVFFFDIPKTERAELVGYCYKHNKDIFVMPDISDIILNHAVHFVVDDTTVFASTTRSMSFEQLVIKRLCDILFSAILLILTSPIMITAAIAIRINDHGPVFYRQARLTKGGKEFNVLKFRSMVVNAESETGAVLAKEKDDRITKVGRVLRRFRIDELPQLFNILKGDMSVVGPRPERMEIAQQYAKELPEFRYRLKVKAGLTGLAQIMSKYNTSPKDKLALDLEYIEEYSILLDIKLMLQTLIVFFKADSTEGMMDEDAITLVKHDKHRD